jgi:hypothetical protein
LDWEQQVLLALLVLRLLELLDWRQLVLLEPQVLLALLDWEQQVLLV